MVQPIHPSLAGLDVTKDHILEMACIITDENLNIVAEVHIKLNNTCTEVVMDSSLGQQVTTYPTQIIITNMLIAGTADSMCYNYYRVTYCCTIVAT